MTWKRKSGRHAGRIRTGLWPSISSSELIFESLTGTAQTVCSHIELFWHYRRNAAVHRKRRESHEPSDGRISNVRSNLVNRIGRRGWRPHDRLHSALVGISSAKTILHLRW